MGSLRDPRDVVTFLRVEGPYFLKLFWAFFHEKVGGPRPSTLLLLMMVDFLARRYDTRTDAVPTLILFSSS